jgi:multiple sugar transport system substrate-binding protein
MTTSRRLVLAALASLAMSGTALAADFNVWGIQTFNPEADRYIGEQLQAFAKEKGISAEYSVVPANVLNERLAAAFEGKAPPDVFMTVGAQIGYYMQQGLTIPLGSVLEKMRQVPGGIFENVVGQGVLNGEVLAVPIEIDVSPMYVRTDFFQKAGVPLPDTWEQLRAGAKAVQAQNPLVAGFGIALSNANDAEGNIRQVIWSFGGAEFAEDGKTVIFNSPETRAAYQFIADMFLVDRTIPRTVLTWDDAGNNTAYQTGRAAVIMNPPSVFFWAQQNDQKLVENTALLPIPKGPGPNGRRGGSVGAWVWAASKDARNHDTARAWLDYFFEPARYEQVIAKVGGRWVPIYKSMMSMPTFTSVPQYAQFGEMAATGIHTGHKGPPTALSGAVNNAKIITNVMQKILVDNMKVEDAVAWGHAEIEKLAAR